MELNAAYFGCLALFTLAVGPRLAWDDFSETEDLPMGFLSAAVMFWVIPFVPLLILAMLPLYLADRVCRWWRASWS